MNIACPHCHGRLFFHYVEATSGGRGLIVHALGLPGKTQVFQRVIPALVLCPHCGSEVRPPRCAVDAVDAVFLDLGRDRHPA